MISVDPFLNKYLSGKRPTTFVIGGSRNSAEHGMLVLKKTIQVSRRYKLFFSRDIRLSGVTLVLTEERNLPTTGMGWKLEPESF
jgi:hypothetical protein